MIFTMKRPKWELVLFFVTLITLLTGACGNVTSVPVVTETAASPLQPIPSITPSPIPVITTPSPLPTNLTIPMITPDVIQVERWQEYEDALAQSILPMFSFESILCEWDILARAGQEVYVWAACGFSGGDDSRPAVIHLGADGSVHNVEIPKRGSSSDIDRIFPKEAQMKFSLYIGNSIFDGRLREMYNHLIYRETHPEEPPLIILLATPIPTPTP